MVSTDFSPRLWGILILTGVIAGLVGIVLTHLLHTVQFVAFSGWMVSHEHISFRELVEKVEPWRRFIVLLLSGGLIGLGWFLLHRFGEPLVEIKVAVSQPERDMPFKTTLCHVLLQIITVGMGSPLGREVAPREMSVALATPLARFLHLNMAQKKIVLACASGAGLAAVYNVPLAATVFVLETLLLTVSAEGILAALLCCSVAVMVARWGLGDMVQYADLPNLTHIDLPAAMMVWAIFAGVLLAFGVQTFGWCFARLPEIPRRRPIIILIAIVAMGLVGWLAMWYPEILGNGKAGVQLGFADLLTWQQALGLLVAKWLAIFLATVAGAYGGRITPSIMLGGLMALLSAMAWNMVLPEISVGAAAFVGAAVFLGLAQNMRLTAIVFMLELSRLSTAFWLPVCLCMATGIMMQTILEKWRNKQYSCFKLK